MVSESKTSGNKSVLDSVVTCEAGWTLAYRIGACPKRPSLVCIFLRGGRCVVKPATAGDLKNMLVSKERGFQHLKDVDKGVVR